MEPTFTTPIGETRAVEHVKFARIILPCFVVAAFLVILVAAVRWSLEHPYGITWDESGYINQVQIDGQRLRAGHVLRLAGRILVKSGGTPPAYRLAALPFVGLFGYHTTEVRLVSLACFALSVSFVYWATRRLTNPSAGALAALIFALSPEAVSACIVYGTDAQLYLGTAAMLYFILAYWVDGVATAANSIGLGLAISLGLLSKTSFFAIFFPLIVFWFFASRWRRFDVPGLLPQRNAFAIALVTAGPWWALNFKAAFAYAAYARGFARNSLGSPSLITWAHWLQTVAECMLGHAMSILIGAVLIAYLVRLVAKEKVGLNRLQRATVGACLCAGLPIMAVQLSGTNHSMRHISPTVIPLAIMIGVLADRSGWISSRLALSVSALLACVQLGMLIVPVIHPNTAPVSIGFSNATLPWRVMSRFEQWDWRPVRTLADRCGVDEPAISYLGNGRVFNPPAIEYPWVMAANSTPTGKTPAPPDVQWLWRYEDAAFDWRMVMDQASQSDLVITAPGYQGELSERDDLDNQYNVEFEQNLSRDPLFQGPYHFHMGRFQPVDVDVFVRKSLVCPSEGLQ